MKPLVWVIVTVLHTLRWAGKTMESLINEILNDSKTIVLGDEPTEKVAWLVKLFLFRTFGVSMPANQGPRGARSQGVTQCGEMK